MGISVNDATLLLPVLGAFNVLGRVVAGWLSDRPWADCLFIHNFALIIAGGATCLVPLMSTYGQLSVYGAVFGCCIGNNGVASLDRIPYCTVVDVFIMLLHRPLS